MSKKQSNISQRPYGIRVSLSDTFLDQVVNLSDSQTGFQIHRQFTLGTLMFFLLSFMIYSALISRSFFIHGGVLSLLIFTGGYFWMSMLLISPTVTHLYGLQLVWPMIKYISGENRNISTKQIDASTDFRNLTGIKGIHARISKNAPGYDYIEFENGDRGQLLEVNGSASRMTFDDDKESILNDVNAFYKQLVPSTKITIDSVVSPQRVTEQLHNKDFELDNMALKNTPIYYLMQQKRATLRDYVGKVFKSWHQYMLIRSPSRSDIRDIDEFLRADVNGPRLFVSYYRVLTYRDIIRYLKRLYGDDVSNLADYDNQA